MNGRRRNRVIAGALTGALSTAAACSIAPALGAYSPVWCALVGALCGATFGALLGTRALGLGSGLVWALGYGFLLWIVAAQWLAPATSAPSRMSMLDLVRAQFPLLVAAELASAPLGLAVGAFAGADRSARHAGVGHALTAGGFAGIVGGWAFGKWMEQVGFFPLIAGLVHSDSRALGVALHFGIAIFIGSSFGFLFRREILGFGSSLGWGAAYGLFWWFLGPLTLLPLLQGGRPDWTSAHAATLFGSLVGHVVYGLIVALLYASVVAVWSWLFERSDPLNREVEAGGTLLLSSLARGAAAGLAGGLPFAFVMLTTGELPRVAALVGATSAVTGFLVHMTISALIGAGYGALFRYETPDGIGAVAWGAVYGLIWWFIGPLTFVPIRLTGAFTWTTQAADAQLAALVGHVLYGVVLGLVFRALECRHLARLLVDVRLARRWERRQRPAGTPAPALWLFFIGTSIALPILLG